MLLKLIIKIIYSLLTKKIYSLNMIKISLNK